MNFVKFFSAESKLTNLRLHTYFIWVGAQFQRWNLGIVSMSRRADETYPLFVVYLLHVFGMVFIGYSLHVSTLIKVPFKKFLDLPY